MQEEKKEEAIDFTQFLVKPHKNKSRDVTEDDIQRVMNDSKVMYNLCHSQIGLYPSFYAICSPQIDDKDPLKLIVFASKELVINPKMINHTKFLLEKNEGCASFADRAPNKVMRYNKITVEYQTLTPEGKLSEVITQGFNGLTAEIWQHELDHLEGKYVYEVEELLNN